MFFNNDISDRNCFVVKDNTGGDIKDKEDNKKKYYFVFIVKVD